MNIKIPGPAWVALVGGLAVWLSTYVDAPWAAGVVAVLGVVGKALEMYMREPVQPATAEMLQDGKVVPAGAPAPASASSAWDRPLVRWWVEFFWG